MTDDEAEREAWQCSGCEDGSNFGAGFRAGLAHARKQSEQSEDKEAARWQNRIAAAIARYGLEPFDASVNESGDPLDWTDDQVAHALGELTDLLDAKIAALERVALGAEQARQEIHKLIVGLWDWKYDFTGQVSRGTDDYAGALLKALEDNSDE